MMLSRRTFLFLSTAVGCLAATSKSLPAGATTIRGKLTQREGAPPAIETAEHKLIVLEGDDAAIKTLQDKRLSGFDMEATGHFISADHFRIDPNHARSVLVHKDGKLKMITYWCDTCSIRSYEPGPCWCCQQETVLELRDPDQQ